MTTPDHVIRVRVLLDPTDDRAVTAALLARHDPLAGCVVVHPTPGAIGRTSLAHDVLAALGRPIGSLRSEDTHSVGSAWSAATAWIVGDCIHQLVVLRAHRLPGDSWTRLAELAATSGATVLLVCHTPAAPAHLHTRLPNDVIVHDALADAVRELDAVRGRPVRDRPPQQEDDLPKVDEPTVAQVDELHRQGRTAACQWLRRCPSPAPGRRPATDAQLQYFLTGLINDSPTRQHTVALLHGVQAGFLILGFQLILPALDDLGGPGLTSTPVTGDVAERIGAGVANPLLAAGVALAMFTGLSMRTLQTLRLDALPPPNQHLQIPYRRTDIPTAHRHPITSTTPQDTTLTLHIPLPAQPLIRAARFFLYDRGPDTRQRIFAGIAPMPHRITDAADRCGLLLPQRPPHLADIWLVQVQWERLNEACNRPTATLHP